MQVTDPEHTDGCGQAHRVARHVGLKGLWVFKPDLQSSVQKDWTHSQQQHTHLNVCAAASKSENVVQMHYCVTHLHGSHRWTSLLQKAATHSMQLS